MRFVFIGHDGAVCDIIECHGLYGYWGKFCRRMFMCNQADYACVLVSGRIMCG